MAGRRPSGIAGSPAMRSVVRRTELEYDTMVRAQFDGARRARRTMAVASAILAVLGVLFAITGRSGGVYLVVMIGSAFLIVLAGNEVLFRWLRRRLPEEER